MSFDIPKINPYTNSGANKVSSFSQSNEINKKPSIFDQIKEDDDKKAKEKDKAENSNQKDSVTLSLEARIKLSSDNDGEIINKALTEQVSQTKVEYTKEAQQKIEEKSIEFKGYKELAKTRGLSPVEQDKVSKIKIDISEIKGSDRIDDNEIIQQANEVLADFSKQVPNLLDNLKNENITGNQFGRLDKINSLLNKANGYGLNDENSKPDVQNIRKQFENSLYEIGDRKLQRDEVALLTQIQKELSTVEDYKIQVTDAIGLDGVVV